MVRPPALGKPAGRPYKAHAMHIVLVDNSIPFDGQSPLSQPLGGAEKAFASLPGALAARGHRVQVFNRAAAAGEIEGASWESWQGARPAACDLLVAYRRPEFLGFVASPAQRILWLAGAAQELSGDRETGLLLAYRPALVFMAEAERAAYRQGEPALKTAAVPPGIRAVYLAEVLPSPAAQPYALATSHPGPGLEWLIKLWVAEVNPLCPHAELRLFSAILDRALRGGAVAEPFKAVADLALASRDKGIAIRPPGSDPVMAEAYRGARAHLYPGDAREVYCFTLAESQACGAPAVARPFAATAAEIGVDVSGHLAADDAAFAQRTRSLLLDDDIYLRLSAGARARTRERSWERAAAAFEAIWQ